MYFSSIVLVIHSFANSKVHMVFLVSLFYRSFLNFVQLCSILLSSFQPLKGHWFHSFVKKQFVLPFPLPFFSGAILDLGTRPSCSGGVL